MPLEACISGRIGIGNDLSPEAYILTHSKVRPVKFKRLHNFLKKLENENFYKKALDFKPMNENIRVFYEINTLKQILHLRDILMNDNSDLGIFVKSLLCGILHGRASTALSLPCSHSFSMSPKYVKKYALNHKLKKPKKDVLKCLEIKANQVLRDGLPSIKGRAYNKDAKNLRLRKESIDLIITSPPYFNKQTYAWDNWLRLWFLGYDYKEISKILFHTGSKIFYFEKMKEYIKCLYDILKNDSACFIVIGDAKINGIKINTAEELAKICVNIGFKVKNIIVDDICLQKRYFMYLDDKNIIRQDKILELIKGKLLIPNNKLIWNTNSYNCI